MVALQHPHKEPAINNKALAWTIGVHALLLLLLFFVSYTIIPPVPPPPVDTTGGLEVNLGSSNNGSGHKQPMRKKDPAAYQAAVIYRHVPERVSRSSFPKDIVRSTEEDAPVVDNTKHTQKTKTEKTLPITDNARHTPIEKTEKPVPVENHKPKAPEKPKYAYAGDNGPGGNSANQNAPGKSEGNTTGPGDRGVPGGAAGAANYTGAPGNGTGGIGHTLTGRTISPDKFVAEFNESGKVVIHVTVDRNGDIIDKRIKSSSSPKLTKLALKELDNAHFSKTNGPEPQQFGDVTIIFKTHQ